MKWRMIVILLLNIYFFFFKYDILNANKHLYQAGEGGDVRHAGKSEWDLGFASFAELLAGLL